MTLPTDPGEKWPPPEYNDAFSKFREWDAWYSGDVERLKTQYAMMTSGYTSPSSQSGGYTTWWRFWSRAGARPASQKALLHVPIAADLAAVSSSLTVGEEPTIRIAEAHLKTPDTTAVAVEDRLKEIIEYGGVNARLTEMAETGSAMGGVYIRPVWDLDMCEWPLMAVIQADAAIPTFKWGILESVIFWRDVERDGETIIRHLEQHTRGVDGGNATIENALYRGAAGTIGERMTVGDLRDKTGLEPLIELPFPDLDAHYIPNIRPNRLWRDSALGLSDYSGAEGMLDALDETYASWMRDIRLAKARIIIPRDMLDESGSMDVDHEIYTPMDMDPLAVKNGGMIAQQFDIRYAAFAATAEDIIERIVQNAGYTPQTFGTPGDTRTSRESGLALQIREKKTLMTVKRKGSWMRPAIKRCLEQMLLIDKVTLKTDGVPDPAEYSVEVALADGIPEDPLALAQTTLAMFQAKSGSAETRVRLLHKDWTDDQVQAEVARILSESTPTIVPGVNAPSLPKEAGGPPGNAPASTTPDEPGAPPTAEDNLTPPDQRPYPPAGAVEPVN